MPQKKRVSRKLSAPAKLCMPYLNDKELAVRPMVPPLEERARDSSGNSEFEIIPDDIVQDLCEDASAKETSFTVKIFDEGSVSPMNYSYLVLLCLNDAVNSSSLLPTETF